MEEPTATDVAERQPDIAPADPVSARIFTAWRRVIGAIVGGLARIVTSIRPALRAWVGQWQLVRRYHVSAAEPWEPDGAAARETAAALGIRAFAFGLVLAGISAAAVKSLWLPGAVTVIGEVLWAGVRFIIIALLMPRDTIDRSRLSVAYLAGLLPYVVGATWLLRVVALALSAILTDRGLRGAGVTGRDARLATGWAFGGQAGIVAGGWLVRALLALAVGG